jgi:glutamine amidotransferase-like uncharacterized protein
MRKKTLKGLVFRLNEKCWINDTVAVRNLFQKKHSESRPHHRDKMRLNYIWIFAASAFLISSSVRADLALVYRGPGSCEEGCSEAAASVAEQDGYKVEYVGPDSNDPALFAHAKVWIQPGGVAATVVESMSADLKNQLRTFIARGGGYVGFCAGAFTATARVGSTRVNGLGILPGLTRLYKGSDPGSILEFIWRGLTRHLYWEGGPYFVFSASSGVEQIATYPDDSAAAVRAAYGKGRVFVTGAHPEAPADWRKNPDLDDPDGLDHDLAIEMVRWATGRGRR